MIVGKPYFIGDSNIDQLVDIIKTLGTPSKTEVINMNPNYDLDDYKFPKLKSKDWRYLFCKIEMYFQVLIKNFIVF
jgi:glycogen synthase kinase 3 beta